MKINKLLIGSMLLVMACTSNTKETAKGYKYTMLKEGSGEPAAIGQFMMINMTFKDAKDSVWNDTRGNEIPMIYPMSEPTPEREGVEEILAMLRKGDSVTFKIPANILFEKTWKQPLPAEVDPTSDFTFYMGVQDILTEEQIRALEMDFMSKASAKQLAEDTAQIDAALAAENIQAQSTPSGLRYTFTKEGKGENAKQGSEVAIHYAGYLMDGTLFDTSMESVARENGAFTEGRPYDPLSLSAGSGQVISGWEEAILLMNKGSKMRVWIPSTLAYGPQRRSALIKENSILVFDMELVDIR